MPVTRTVTITSASQPPQTITSADGYDLLDFAAAAVRRLLPGLPNDVVNDIEDHVARDMEAAVTGCIPVTDTIQITWATALTLRSAA